MYLIVIYIFVFEAFYNIDLKMYIDTSEKNYLGKG
jgi:hypothetical protein